MWNSLPASAGIGLSFATLEAKPAYAQVWIIHGHATGKLRQEVHAFLQQHSRVKHYEPAEQADGGSGVTVAHIK